MKKYRFLFIIGIALLPLLSGCPERGTVTTVINPDGSCKRIVGVFDPAKFKGIDSIKHELSVPIDNSWSLETLNDTTAVLMKEFESVDELNSLYSRDESELKAVNREVKLKKEFRWFYTAFKYYETFGGFMTEIPLTNYLTEEEIEILRIYDSEKHPAVAKLDPRSQKSLNDNIDDRLDFWLSDHIYLMVFNDIIDIADSIDLIRKQDYNLEEIRDTLKYQIDHDEKQFISFDLDDEMDMIDLAGLLGKQLKLDSTSVDQLKIEVERANLEERLEDEIIVPFLEEYYSDVIMPGFVIDTNAETIKGDTLHWFIHPAQYMGNDFVMYAESRVTNNWAYILSGFILTIALIIPFLRKKKA